MGNSKKGYTPMMEKPDYRKSQGAKTRTEDFSISCFVFVLNGGVVDWKSAKQSTTAMYSTEAEYIVVAKASIEVVWMRKFITGLGGVMLLNKGPIEMLCDNEPALAIASISGSIDDVARLFVNVSMLYDMNEIFASESCWVCAHVI
ncbi:hypothetical protein Tco_0102731 [Tanacetum coccineum]